MSSTAIENFLTFIFSVLTMRFSKIEIWPSLDPCLRPIPTTPSNGAALIKVYRNKKYLLVINSRADGVLNCQCLFATFWLFLKFWSTWLNKFQKIEWKFFEKFFSKALIFSHKKFRIIRKNMQSIQRKSFPLYRFYGLLPSHRPTVSVGVNPH